MIDRIVYGLICTASSGVFVASVLGKIAGVIVACIGLWAIIMGEIERKRVDKKIEA